MSKHHRLDVKLTLLGPILTHGNDATEPGNDAPMARDAFGRFMLPYSLIKGKILDAFRDLRSDGFENYTDPKTGRKKYRIIDPELGAWLGREPEGGNLEPERGRLRFSDFATDEKGRSTADGDHDHLIERIQIDQSTGATAGRMLAMIEAPFGYEQPVAFEGRVEFTATDDEAARIATALRQAFDWVSAYGAMRTVGFGRKHEITATLGQVAPTAQGSPTESVNLPIRYNLDRPLCVVGRKHSGNHFEALDHLPGAVLKGAVARLVLELNGKANGVIDPQKPEPRFPTLCRHFEVIRFGEAKPMKASDRVGPVEPPLSIVVSMTGEKPYYDAALSPDAKLVGHAAPAFMPDWKDKDFETVRGAFGWSLLPRVRRTRTAIDPDRWRATDAQLFSYGLVLPKRTAPDDTPEEYVWEGVIGLENVPDGDRPAVRRELHELLSHGLPNIGKTRATAHVEWLAGSTPPKIGWKADSDGFHVVTLQTDCLMTDPNTLQSKSLHAAYAEFWAEASGGALALAPFFARQALHGGFPSRRANRAKYEPFLLTERGSVFVLKPTGTAKAAGRLAEWRDRGLPAPAWVKRYGEPLWRTCPYLPHVGYGEVAIDLVCHTEDKLP